VIASRGVSLREVTPQNRADVTALAVAPGQRQFVEGVAESISEAAATPRAKAWYRAIYAGQVPVGFVMISDGISEDDLADPLLLGPYFLWRLLIDARYQGQGFGAGALRLVTEYVRGRPGAEVLLTSCGLGEGSPLAFYEKQGFCSTGVMHENELVLERVL
jgi:diamine N-acetyltransferase